MIRANILPHREEEVAAIDYIWNQVNEDKRIVLPEACHVEGGDVMPLDNHIFIGTYSGEDYPELITARTNMDAVISIQELFPDKIVKSI